MANSPDLATIRDLFKGSYEVIEPLPWSGLCLCYRARRLDAECVILILPIETEGRPDVLRLFQARAEAIDRFEHSGVVPSRAYGLKHGVPFFELELVDARPLHDVLQIGPVPERRAVRIALGLLEALEVLHAAGLYHGDLTPTNVLLRGADEPLIVGPGIAPLIRKARDHRSTGPTGKGSGPHATDFLAPEIATEGRSDGRADVYSVAALLKGMLTDERPSAANTRLPSRLEPVLTRALSANPLDRFADAPSFSAALREAAGTKSLLPPPTRGRRWVPWAVAAASLAAGGAVAYAVTRSSPSADPVVADSTQELPLTGESGLVPTVRENEELGPDEGEAEADSREETQGETDGETETETEVAVDHGIVLPNPDDPIPAFAHDLSGALPPTLDDLRARIMSSEDVGRNELTPLYRHARLNRNDPAAHLVLAVAFANLGWSTDAVDRYRQAALADPAATTFPRMMPDLIRLAQRDESGPVAAAAVINTYGAVALPAVRLAIEDNQGRQPAHSRLENLQTRLERL